jgi:Tol biopolymer transport system component
MTGFHIRLRTSGSNVVRLSALSLVFVLLLMASLAMLPISPQPAAAQSAGGRIVFVSDRNGNDEIYVMNADGSNQTRLTNHPGYDIAPVWSPDGSRIAFVSDRDGNYEIYVMNADGSGQTRLTFNDEADIEPDWSPDGGWIVFSSYRDGNWEIYNIGIDGNNLGRLTYTEDAERRPDWSPDGSRIALDVRSYIDKSIVVMNADGSDRQVVTNAATVHTINPKWSPDGSRLLYQFGLSPLWIIAMINPDGSGDTTIFEWEDDVIYPAGASWSPDGSQLVFTALVDELRNEVAIMNSDGSGLQFISLNPANDTNPDWIATTAPAPAPAPAEPSGNALFFEETGLYVDGRIREYWQANGGLPVFGLPITPQQTESIEGQSISLQWFERNRLELHPENEPPYDVLLGRLGADRLAQQGYDWQSVPPEEPQDGCRYFEQTGRNVCGDILAAWRADGLELDGRPGFTEAENLALFGLPLTGLMTETLSDGNEYQVQYFERARFELHPENEPPFNVLLGLLGREVSGTT